MGIMETLFDQETLINNYVLEENRKSEKRGEKRKAEKIALKMLDDGADIQYVCSMTGLSEKEINQLILTK